MKQVYLPMYNILGVLNVIFSIQSNKDEIHIAYLHLALYDTILLIQYFILMEENMEIYLKQ